jgi:hypothetical protein
MTKRHGSADYIRRLYLSWFRRALEIEPEHHGVLALPLHDVIASILDTASARQRGAYFSVFSRPAPNNNSRLLYQILKQLVSITILCALFLDYIEARRFFLCAQILVGLRLSQQFHGAGPETRKATSQSRRRAHHPHITSMRMSIHSPSISTATMSWCCCMDGTWTSLPNKIRCS